MRLLGHTNHILNYEKMRNKKQQDRQVFAGKKPSILRYYDGYGFEIESDKLILRFGRSRGDEVNGIEVQIQSRKDVKFTKVIHV